MARISPENHERLRKGIYDHAFLHRILRRIEYLHRVVFHARDLDWRYVRAAAEEILIADVLTRHGGCFDGVYFHLRRSEDAGHEWQSAINDYAAYAHNCFTTPLGVVVRKDFFGEACHFVTPEALADSPLYHPE